MVIGSNINIILIYTTDSGSGPCMALLPWESPVGQQLFANNTLAIENARLRAVAIFGTDKYSASTLSVDLGEPYT